MAIGKLTRRNTRRPSHGGSTQSQLQDIGEDKARELEVRKEENEREMERRSRSPEVKKIDWEIPRKTLHSSIGIRHTSCCFYLLNLPFLGFFVIPLYTRGVTAQPVILVLSGALVIISAVDILRLNNPAFAKIYERVMGFLMRDSEKVCNSISRLAYFAHATPPVQN